jgi:hypothetical protein
VLAGLQLQFVD